MTLRAFFACLLLSSASTAALATEAEPAKPYAGVMGSYLKADSQRDGSSGYGGAVYGGVGLLPNLNLEVSAYGSLLSRDTDDGTDKFAGLGADLQGLLPLGGVSLFALGGLGMQYDHLGFAVKSSRYSPYLDAGLGLLAPLNQKLALRVEARGYYVFDSDMYAGGSESLDARFNLGVQYSFGGTKGKPPVVADGDDDHDGVANKLDRCPGTAPGTAVDAEGCPLASAVVAAVAADAAAAASKAADDADGDGIPDKLDQCPGTPYGVAVDAKGCPLSLDSDGDGVPDAQDQCPGTPQGLKVDAKGCIVEQTAIIRSINFEFGSDRLTTEAKATLDQLAASLLNQPGLRLEIAGHTDSLGPQAMNLTLSQKRAVAVKAYLVAHGVASERLKAEGYGEFNPLTTNDTEEGRAQNRRVEFRILSRPAGGNAPN